jgi:hypothetical protein
MTWAEVVECRLEICDQRNTPEARTWWEGAVMASRDKAQTSTTTPYPTRDDLQVYRSSFPFPTIQQSTQIYPFVLETLYKYSSR